MDNKIKTFETDSLALAPFLLNRGLKFMKTEVGIGKNNRKKVFFIFADPKEVGKELEMTFLHSDERRYKESTHYFRNQIKLAQENDGRI